MQIGQTEWTVVNMSTANWQALYEYAHSIQESFSMTLNSNSKHATNTNKDNHESSVKS